MSEASRDRIAGGTIVLRDRRVVYATVGAQALFGRVGRDLLGRELLELLAPEDRERVLERHERRLRGEPVPSEYEMQLLLPDGARRTAEARVALDGNELVIQLQDLSGQDDRRRRLEGLAALGVAIHRERTAAAIHERVRTGLAALGLAPMLMRPRGDGIELVWARLPDSIGRPLTALLQRPLEGLVGPWSPFSREAWDAGAAYSDDWVAHAAHFARQGKADRLAAGAAAYGLVRGLAVRLDERAGPTDYLVAVGEWVRGDDLPAFRLFGAQVAAALDAARDIAELSARNFDLAALAELGVLAGTSATLDEFMPQALEVVMATAGGQATAVFGVSTERQRLELVHVAGLDRALPDMLSRGDLDSPLGVVAREHRAAVVHLEDLEPDQGAWLEAAGLATFALVPLVARTRTLGVLVAAWRERLDADGCRLELLLAMGAHVAAVMESQELLLDQRRRVAELTLLNDVAVATASLDPVLLLENALHRICETFEADGGMAHLLSDGVLELQASVRLPAETAALLRHLGPEEGPAGQALARRQPVVDLAPELAGARCNEARLRDGLRTLIAIPLLAKERAVGALCLFRRSPRAFAAGDVTLLSAIGVQLGVAVDAARQHADVRRRARDLEAIHALALRALSAEAGETATLLQEAAGAVSRAMSARQVAILLLDGGGATLAPAASHGVGVPPEAWPAQVARSPMTAEALRTGAPSWTENTRTDPRSALLGRTDVSAVAMLAVPLAARAGLRGVMLVADAPGHRFSVADQALGMALGAELALALENAGLYADLQLEQEKNIRKTRLEALGELAAVIAHEVRNPLGVIFNSLGSLRRLAGGAGDSRMLLDIVSEEADRLNRIVGDLLDFARHSPPQLAPDRLEQVVDEAVGVALAQPPAGLEVVRQLGTGLPEVPLDAGQVRQAVLNLVVNAVQAMPGGGRLTVRTFLEGASAVVEVEDTGAGIAEGVRARIFEPFFTTKATGTGLGLPVVKRIVEGHGGELGVRTGPGGSCFSMRFPLAAPSRQATLPVSDRVG